MLAAFQTRFAEAKKSDVHKRRKLPGILAIYINELTYISPRVEHPTQDQQGISPLAGDPPELYTAGLPFQGSQLFTHGKDIDGDHQHFGAKAGTNCPAE
jgi:hypothetical protein